MVKRRHNERIPRDLEAPSILSAVEGHITEIKKSGSFGKTDGTHGNFASISIRSAAGSNGVKSIARNVAVVLDVSLGRKFMNEFQIPSIKKLHDSVFRRLANQIRIWYP